MKTLRKLPKALFLIVVTCISLIPFICMILMATHTTEEIFAGQMFSIGDNLANNAANVFTSLFFTSYMNSLFVSLCSTGVAILCCSMMGYALVAYRFRIRNGVYNFILITMMIPGSIKMIGFMNEMRILGWSSTLLPLIVVWCANGFGAFWMTQYMKNSLKMEIVESGRIDGASELMIFFRIVFPCISPAVGTLGLMIFLWSWNSYLLPLVLVSNTDNYTIPLFIETLGNQYQNDYAAKMTGLVIAIFPLITAFALGSKNFIRGLTAGAVKE